MARLEAAEPQHLVAPGEHHVREAAAGVIERAVDAVVGFPGVDRHFQLERQPRHRRRVRDAEVEAVLALALARGFLDRARFLLQIAIFHGETEIALARPIEAERAAGRVAAADGTSLSWTGKQDQQRQDQECAHRRAAYVQRAASVKRAPQPAPYGHAVRE